MKKSEIDCLQSIAEKLLLMCANAQIENDDLSNKVVQFRNSVKIIYGNDSPRRAKEDVLQFNKKEQSCISSEKEDDTMNFNIPHSGVGKTPRKDGRFQGYVVIKNHKYYAYGKTREDVKKRIIEYIKNGGPKRRKKSKGTTKTPTKFDAFAMFYFERFRKKKVLEYTYKCDMNRYENHIKPYLGEKQLKKITPMDCQDVIDRITASGKGKTADEIFSLLSYIFKGAILFGIIDKNPLSIVYREKHETKHGKAFSQEEIFELIEKTKNSICQASYMILLCTGLRPNELATVRIDGDFIIAVNSKRKNKKVEYKKIPIIEDLKPFLKIPIHLASPLHLRKQIGEFFPNHRLYDLRTTFYSKCVECGVAEAALKEFVGHSSGVLADSYTSLSDAYLLAEGKKIRFNLTKEEF